jgi:transcriptional regulator GlxA family with amidase domain
MHVFRQAYGVSLLSYLTQHRVAHAQQQLATSNLGVLEIGLAAGFGSASRFYSAFRAACGMSPGAYRASLQLTPRDREQRDAHAAVD